MNKKALIGFHHPAWESTVKDAGEIRKWEVESVQTLDDMIQKARTHAYALYLMDANFGQSNSPDITACETVYDIVKASVELKTATFMAVTGNEDALDACRKKNIPVIYKGKFNPLYYFKK